MEGKTLVARRTIVGLVLQDCRTANNLDYADLAAAMDAANFLGRRYRVDELEKLLRQIENATLDDPWPPACTFHEFVACLDRCLSTRVGIRVRFDLAGSLDDYARWGC